MADEQKDSGAGSAAQAGAALDISALVAALTPEINKAVNGMAKGLKKDLTTDLSKLFAPQQAAQTGEAHSEGAQGEGQQQGAQAHAKPDPAVAALQRQLADLRTEREADKLASEKVKLAAELKERNADIKSALGKYKLNSVDAAFRIVRDDVTRGEDGELYGGDLPLDQYLADVIKKNQYLLQPEPTTGAGARAGNGRGSGGRVWTDEDLKPENFSKLKPEERAALNTHILGSLST